MTTPRPLSSLVIKKVLSFLRVCREDRAVFDSHACFTIRENFLSVVGYRGDIVRNIISYFCKYYSFFKTMTFFLIQIVYAEGDFGLGYTVI